MTMQSKTLCMLVAAAALAATAGCNRHTEEAAPSPSATPASTGGDQSGASSAATPSSGAAVDGAGGAPSSGSTMAAIDDTALTAKVKAELLAESSLKAGDISVTTVQGTVTLTGAVDNAAQSDKAAQIAKDTSGVKGVDNQLTVKK